MLAAATAAAAEEAAAAAAAAAAEAADASAVEAAPETALSVGGSPLRSTAAEKSGAEISPTKGIKGKTPPHSRRKSMMAGDRHRREVEEEADESRPGTPESDVSSSSSSNTAKDTAGNQVCTDDFPTLFHLFIGLHSVCQTYPLEVPALRPKSQPCGPNLSLEAPRLGFGPRGWDEGLQAEIWA